jgi:hypothetical protein
MPAKRSFALGWKMPEYMKLLPKFFDRCEASRYFLIQADEPKGPQNWYARASLNEFKSALDLIMTDMKAIGLDKEWRRSEEKVQLENDLIIKMIRGCRGLSFHAGSVDTRLTEKVVRIVGSEESGLGTVKSLFVDGMGEQAKEVRPKLTSDEIRQITEIEDGIPLFMLLAECYKQAQIFLENFLVDHGRLDIAESNKFWKIDAPI